MDEAIEGLKNTKIDLDRKQKVRGCAGGLSASAGDWRQAAPGAASKPEQCASGQLETFLSITKA